MDFKQTSCDVSMRFGKLRDYSVKIGNDQTKTYGCLQEYANSLMLAVVKMTTTNRSHPAFARRLTKVFENVRSFPIFEDF